MSTFGIRPVSHNPAFSFYVFKALSDYYLNFQTWLNTKPKKIYFPTLICGVMIFYQLIEHVYVWQINNAREAFGKVFGTLPTDLAGNSINNHADPGYFMVLAIGLGITLLTGIFLIWQAWRVNPAYSKTISN